MTSRMWSSISRLAALGLGVSLFATGCHREHPQFAARANVVAGDPIAMQVVDASARGRRIRIRAWLENHADHDIMVDRNALALRLADGRVLPVSYSRRHRPYVFAPGKGRMLKVDFRADGNLGDMTQASLTIGGKDATTPNAQTGMTCTTVPPGAVIVIGGQPGVIPPPLHTQPTAPATSDDDDDDDDTNDAAGPAPAAALPAPTNAVKPPAQTTETWQIGGGTTRN